MAYRYRVTARRSGTYVAYFPECRIDGNWGGSWVSLPNSSELGYVAEEMAWQNIQWHANKQKAIAEAEAMVDAFKVREFSADEVLKEKYNEPIRDE